LQLIENLRKVFVTWGNILHSSWCCSWKCKPNGIIYNNNTVGDA
jgi:hypothetical protein